MAIALVQSKTQAPPNYVNSYTAAFASSITAGSTLILSVTAGDANTVSSIVDNNTNSWNLIASDLNTGQRQTWMYYAFNAHSGATTITITWGSGQFADSVAFIEEWSGLTTTDPLDKSAHANDAGGFVTSHSTGTTAATTLANEAVVATVGAPDSQDPAWVVPAGYNNLVSGKGFDAFTYGAIASKIVSSTGTQGGTFTTTDSVCGQGIVATFKGATQPSAVNSGFFRLMA